MVERPLTGAAGVWFRDATEADHARFVHLVREWWDERPPRLERLWFRHFASSTVVGESDGRRPVALAVAFPSVGLPARGVLLLVAVAPPVRRRGVGRAAVEAALERLRASGATSAEATVWPGNRTGHRFLEALGFRPDASATTHLYGLPAIADYDGDGEDRALLVREIGEG